MPIVDVILGDCVLGCCAGWAGEEVVESRCSRLISGGLADGLEARCDLPFGNNAVDFPQAAP